MSSTGKRKEECDKYLAKLRTQAIIDWKNTDVKKAYEEGLVEQAKTASAIGTSGRQRRYGIQVAHFVQNHSRLLSVNSVVRRLDAFAARASGPEQLQRKRFEVFLPTISRWSRWKDRKKKIDWPLFRATVSSDSTRPTRFQSSSARVSSILFRSRANPPRFRTTSSRASGC